MSPNTLLLLFLCLSVNAFSQGSTPLEKSWDKHIGQFKEGLLHLQYQEAENNFTHSMNPWEQSSYTILGSIWMDKKDFRKVDTLTTRSGRTYFSKLQIENDTLLYLDYGDDELYEITKSFVGEKLLHTCRYSPVRVLDYFQKRKATESLRGTPETATYELNLNEYRLSLDINRKTHEVTRISSKYDIESDDQYYGFGDVEDVYTYSNYTTFEGSHIPLSVQVTKLNGELVDEITLSHPTLVERTTPLLKRPDDYQVHEDKVVEADVTIEKYTDQISFINLHHVGTRSLMVEFSDFILVAEAPLNSESGELLLNEVRKIAPNKPIKYFVFGHFHPHYTGGIRPFIHQGATVLCTQADETYIEHIAEAKYTINPDRLAQEPRPINFEFVDDKKIIKDKNLEMQIFHIGDKSNHTSDYMIYYFPEEKMIFQDDLVRIRSNSNKDNVSKTTSGFYHAVKDLGLDVETVVQNWSVFNKANRMIFKFEDIEKLVVGE